MTDNVVLVMIAAFWLGGIAIAKGIWSTFFAIVIPQYAWYLVIERGLMMAGWI